MKVEEFPEGSNSIRENGQTTPGRLDALQGSTLPTLDTSYVYETLTLCDSSITGRINHTIVRESENRAQCLFLVGGSQHVFHGCMRQCFPCRNEEVVPYPLPVMGRCYIEPRLFEGKRATMKKLDIIVSLRTSVVNLKGGSVYSDICTRFPTWHALSCFTIPRLRWSR